MSGPGPRSWSVDTHEELGYGAIRAGHRRNCRRGQVWLLNQLPPSDAAAVAECCGLQSKLAQDRRRLLNHRIGYVYGWLFRRTASAGGRPDPAAWTLGARCVTAQNWGSQRRWGMSSAMASHRSELGVIVWTTMIAGLRTYGATLRKMILRIAGGSDRRSPGFADHDRGVAKLRICSASYLLAFFVVLFVAAYVGLSSGRLAYAGQQAGVSLSWRIPLEPQRRLLYALVARLGHLPGARRL